MDQSRHLGVYNIPYFTQVSLVGCGGIGSITAVTLAKMGVNFLELWDGDCVESVNIATQLHLVSGAGKRKVISTAELVYQVSDEVRVLCRDQEVIDSTSFARPEIVISAVDSIQARQDIWKSVLKSGPKWYIDARMSAEVFQMAVVCMGSSTGRDHYDARLMSLQESDVPEVVCTQKATFYCAAHAAGHIGAAVKRIFTDAADRSFQVVHYIATNTLYEFNL
jgi:molybdopterin/thiamine biosynthesis adenylyltransferase